MRAITMDIEQHTGNMPSGSGVNGDRTYRDEHSWDQLEEDEHGRLRSSVRCVCVCLRGDGWRLTIVRTMTCLL